MLEKYIFVYAGKLLNFPIAKSFILKVARFLKLLITHCIKMHLFKFLKSVDCTCTCYHY